MQRLTRRSLIGRAVAAGAGATVLSSFGPIPSATASASPEAHPAYDPGFLKGTVVSGGSGAFSVSSELGGVQLVSVPDPSLVWKQGSQGGLLAVGDVVSARGDRQADGSLQVSAAWVDIHNVEATVVQAGESQLQVKFLATHAASAAGSIGIIPSTEVFVLPYGEPTTGNRSGIQAGDIVRAVGYGDPTASSFVATRVFVVESASYSPPASGPDDQVTRSGPATPASYCNYTYGGITSWFSCNGYAACSCEYCSSSYLEMAWPLLTTCGGAGDNSGCNGNVCGSTCCPEVSNTYLSCGKEVAIYDPCSDKSVSVVVADNGPCVRCVSAYGCLEYHRVKFDLTQAAFSVLRPLSDGLTDVQATVSLPC